MFLHSYAVICVFLLCFGLHKSTFVLEEGIQNLFLAKYRLFENPKRALTSFCKETPKSGPFTCNVAYYWNQDHLLQDVCKTPRSRWFFPRRYYTLVLQCSVGKVPIEGLKSEWRVFY